MTQQTPMDYIHARISIDKIITCSRCKEVFAVVTPSDKGVAFCPFCGFSYKEIIFRKFSLED